MSPPTDDTADSKETNSSAGAGAFLDTRGLSCPLPVLKARKKLLAMPAGAVLEVAATDPVAALDMPHFCNEAGHDLLDKRAEDGVLYFRIRRKDGAS